MVSFVSRKAFEMAMRVSLTRLDSSLMSRENLVLNFTILFDSKSDDTIIHWMKLRSITSGSTHPAYKKSRALSVLGKMLYVFALSQGALLSTLQI